MGKSGWRNCNLRTRFLKILKRAGVQKWPRLFRNIRSSRQTELAEIFPSHVVCAWMDNSEDIAKKHYLQVIDAHFATATGMALPSKRTELLDMPELIGVEALMRLHAELRVLLPNVETDGVGFEPTSDFRRCRFSRPVHSTALPPIRRDATQPAIGQETPPRILASFARSPGRGL
jgi:hypothetical protein